MGSQESDIVLIFVSSALIAVILAGLVAVFVVVYQKRIVAKNLQLQQLENDRNHDLLKATIEGQERERKRLAKDLHDGIGSLLAGLKFNLSHQQKSTDISRQQADFLAEACDMLDDGMAAVRRVSHNLLPVTLEDFGLLKAIEECIEPMQQAETFSVSLHTRGTPTRVAEDIELGLLRVVQELLHNTLHHAQASLAEITVKFDTQTIDLDYKDNGMGMTDKDKKPGLGIKSIYSRIQALNGSIEITTSKDRGFATHIQVPINSTL